MHSTPIKTRFAPSPTGELHLGNVRTALFNALMARREGGTFLLRIEDTDQARSRSEYQTALEADLGWLGLDWQEGPRSGGAAGPYRQSERAAVYAEYFARLEAEDHAYPCFCSQQELSVSRKVQQAAGRPPRYAGTCAKLTAAEREARRAKGLHPTLRFRVPGGRDIQFEDMVRGIQSFKSDDIGDFVIRRADGSAAFFFCNALDDALMGVTHVLRGEDHLANTPRQLLLLEALGLTIPSYGHIALIVGDDGSPLSKRHGSTSIRALREEGILPLALTNHLARLGHTYESDAFMSLEQLAQSFDPTRLGKSPARHDPGQLLHWQKEALARASEAELWGWLTESTISAPNPALAKVPAAQAHAFMGAVRDNIVYPADAAVWADALYAPPGDFDAAARVVLQAAGAAFFVTAIRLMPESLDDFKAYVKALGAATGRKGKDLFMPLRAAMSGQTTKAAGQVEPSVEPAVWQHGPELGRIAALLGSERVRERLQAAEQLCHSMSS